MAEPLLIYTDPGGSDAGSVSDFTLDMEFGLDGQSQSFEATFAGPALRGGEYLYIDATEFGGVVDQVETLSTVEGATYSGRTWQGVLACKVVGPDPGRDYYTSSGDLNSCIAAVVSRCGLSSLFKARAAASGLTVSGFQWDRYTDAYSGLAKMCEAGGGTLCMRHSADPAGGRVELWAEPVRTAGEDEADSDVMEIGIVENHRVVNHLVCLGKGDLKDRVVVHLYADARGNVSQTQTLRGVDEVAEVYDYSNAERDELVEQGTKRLKEYQVQGSVSADALEAAGYGWRVGDRLQAADMAHNRSVTAPITGMVVKVSKGVLTVDYEVGDAEGAVGAVTGPAATSAGKAALSAAQVAQDALSSAYQAGTLAKDTARNAIKSTAYKYSLGTADAPGTAWVPDPDWSAGEHWWRVTVWTYGDGTVGESDPEPVTGPAGEPATYICIDPSAGTTFRRDDTETVLQATVIHGGGTATTFAALQAMLPGASLEWTRVEQDGSSTAVPPGDPRISDSGMALTVLPSDVSCKAVFNVTLTVPD